MDEKAVKNEVKQVPTTLDTVPWGDESLYSVKKISKTLPSGVSSKELYGDVIRIAFPALVELTLTSLVSMVDMMMVGSLGTAAISAVSLAIQPRFLFMSLILALGTGSTALIARARGMGKRELACSIMDQTLFLSVFISVFCSVAGYLLSEPMVRFMANDGLEESTILMSADYLKIQMMFFSLVIFTSAITAVLRGVGNSRSAMIYNVVANLVNILFNWLLINGNLGFPKLGVNGASIATVIGQGVGLVIAFFCILGSKKYLFISFKRKFRFDKGLVKEIMKIGSPAMGEQLIMRAGVIIFARTVATLGETLLATHQICMNIQSLSFMNGQAFAVSATSLVGQSLGKRRPDMAEHYGLRCRRLGLAVSLLLGVLFAIFGKSIVGLYNDDPEVLRYGGTLMYFIALLQPIQTPQFVLAGALRGAGDTRVVALITLLTVLVLRTSLAYLFINVLSLGIYGAWIAIGVDQTVRSLLVTWRYYSGKWKHVKVNI